MENTKSTIHTGLEFGPERARRGVPAGGSPAVEMR
jgi:hypothetical protein